MELSEIAKAFNGFFNDVYEVVRTVELWKEDAYRIEILKGPDGRYAARYWKLVKAPIKFGYKENGDPIVQDEDVWMKCDFGEVHLDENADMAFRQALNFVWERLRKS
ncbi:MAG: hypothetical protein ACLQU2_37325 [Candidatus Binataceae bacterium]